MTRKPPRPATRLIHSEARAPEGFGSLTTPIHHASTVTFDSVEAWRQRGVHRYDGYTYGLTGTPTSLTLAARIAELEGGTRCVLTPSGLSAIALTYLALLKRGDHVLVPDNVYGPSRELATQMLAGWGIEASFYDPLAGSAIAAALRPNTRLVWLEAPGSVTMEVPDVPAITAIARAHGALIAIDNTWSAGVYFNAMEHGCDIAMQALTKYQGGHADLLMGGLTVRDEALYRRLKDAAGRIGLGVSGDDCYLVLRGLATLHARLARHQASALAVARWLSEQPQVKRVLHPALESCPGHAFWQRDFTGASGLFSFVLDARYPFEQVAGMIDGLRWFAIGESWGGPVSLALPRNPRPNRSAVPWSEPGQLVRLHIGLEDPEDLIEDLADGLARLTG